MMELVQFKLDRQPLTPLVPIRAPQKFRPGELVQLEGRRFEVVSDDGARCWQRVLMNGNACDAACRVVLVKPATVATSIAGVAFTWPDAKPVNEGPRRTPVMG